MSFAAGCLALWCAQWIGAHALSKLGLPIPWCLGLCALAPALLPMARARNLKALALWLGFPAQLGALSSALPAIFWLLPLGALGLIFPWRSADAPLFPTPKGALDELPTLAPLAPGARVLDAGCGLGAGLQELRRAYPLARLEGVERSAALAWLCAWRLRGSARVRQADIWALDWSDYEMVYLFQRPESMALARERFERMAPGAWLVSLEFELPGQAPSARLELGVKGSRALWIYQRAQRLDEGIERAQRESLAPAPLA